MGWSLRNWFRKDELKNRAEHGDPDAQYQMAVRYSEGLGVRQNNHKAEELFCLSAQNGVTESQFMMGVLNDTELGRSGTAEPHAANEWYALAAGKGDTQAQFNLAYNYEHGIGAPVNLNEAINWYTKAADAGVPKANFCLGCIYAADEGYIDYPAAYSRLEAAASAGFPRAGYVLFAMYGEGVGLKEPNIFLAQKWIKRAAAEGDAPSMFILAHLTIYGSDYVEKNESEAWRLMEASALAGCLPAMSSLGLMYCYGIAGRTPDFVVAYSLLTAASIGGDAAATDALALMHLRGMSVTADPAKAAQLLKQATEAGEPCAANNLANLCVAGLIPGGTTEAARLYGLARDHGSSRAAQNLAALPGTDPLFFELVSGSITLSFPARIPGRDSSGNDGVPKNDI